jgi:hypothetical protein
LGALGFRREGVQLSVPVQVDMYHNDDSTSYLLPRLSADQLYASYADIERDHAVDFSMSSPRSGLDHSPDCLIIPHLPRALSIKTQDHSSQIRIRSPYRVSDQMHRGTFVLVCPATFRVLFGAGRRVLRGKGAIVFSMGDGENLGSVDFRQRRMA